jgi:hypothetical protein
MALGVFHCGAQNFDAIGGTADIDWPPAPIASEAYDPSATLAVHCGNVSNPINVPVLADTMLSPELGSGYAAARVHHASRRRGIVAADGVGTAAGSRAPHRGPGRLRRGRSGGSLASSLRPVSEALRTYRKPME